jgi:signal peptidase complex subunit 2
VFSFCPDHQNRSLLTKCYSKISVLSKVNKNKPTYYLDVTTTSPSSTPTTRQIRTPFTTWFTADGYFVAKPFQQWLARSVETVGDVDLKNAGRDERDELAAPGPAVPTNMVASAALGETQATGIESNSTKKTKRRA